MRKTIERGAIMTRESVLCRLLELLTDGTVCCALLCCCRIENAGVYLSRSAAKGSSVYVSDVIR
jgi:hypothetical protein